MIGFDRDLTMEIQNLKKDKEKKLISENSEITEVVVDVVEVEEVREIFF